MRDDSSSSGRFLRVTLQERDVQELLSRFPMLSRTEISDVVTRHGPMRDTVEAELERISARKR
jgi:hypothetical protein